MLLSSISPAGLHHHFPFGALPIPAPSELPPMVSCLVAPFLCPSAFVAQLLLECFHPILYPWVQQYPFGLSHEPSGLGVLVLVLPANAFFNSSVSLVICSLCFALVAVSCNTLLTRLSIVSFFAVANGAAVVAAATAVAAPPALEARALALAVRVSSAMVMKSV